MSRVKATKNILLTLIKDMLNSNPDVCVPSAVEDRILEENGCPQQRIESENDNSDLPQFVKHLQNWIEETYGEERKLGSNAKSEDFAQFNETEEKWLDGGREDVNNLLTAIDALKETVSSKENYLKILKSKCAFHDKNVSVLMQKLNFLEYQFLHKLYIGDNSLNAHLRLQENLIRDIKFLRASCDKAVTLNDQYEGMKKNKEFLDLYRVYKELKKIEKRTEIIGNL